MPRRPRQHELDTAATRFAESQLPASWTCQPISPDYGKDLRVEIFQNQEATAYEFYVQSKGHERFPIVRGDKIAQPIRVSTLRYLEKQIIPTMIVAYSAEENRACYLWITPYILDVLNNENPLWRETAGDSEITIHVPLVNNFENVSIADTVLRYVAVVYTEILKRSVNSTYNPSTNPRGLVEREPVRVVLPSRLRPLQIRGLLHRTRLTQKLQDAIEYSSVFLHADAGYGKTWLIADFLSNSELEQVVWYTFDETSIATLKFIEELAGGLYEHTRKAGISTLSHLKGRANETRLSEAIGILIDELHSLESPTLLILEDLHNITDNSTGTCIQELLSQSFLNLKIILSSRHSLPFKYQKLIAQRQLTILEREEIAFDLHETQEYFQEIAQLALSQEQVSRLFIRTGHWIAAISLATSLFAQISVERVEGLLSEINGFDGNIYDFFAEEVYTSLSEDEQHLLKRLSLVQIIQPSIVDLFTQKTDGGLLLRELFRKGTFLQKDSSDSYRFHSLFAEFLCTRFSQEEGQERLLNTHIQLAHYYQERTESYLQIRHAVQGKAYTLAVDGLEFIAPVAINLGYGHFLLELVDDIPESYLAKSAQLQEMLGRAAYQVSEFDVAKIAFSKARALYLIEANSVAQCRLDYFNAEIDLESRKIDAQEFVEQTKTIALLSYDLSEEFFGCQVELRSIEVAQTLTIKSEIKSTELEALLSRSEILIARIRSLGTEYKVIEAKALGAKAHIILQIVVTGFQGDSSYIRLREEVGHGVSRVEKLAKLKSFLAGWNQISELYENAELLTCGEDDIQWAFIHTRHLEDQLHIESLIRLIGLSNSSTVHGSVNSTVYEAMHFKKIREWYLPEIAKCEKIFKEHHLIDSLAYLYCFTAEIFDSLEDIDNRNKIAHHALALSKDHGLEGTRVRAERIIAGTHTFSWVREQSKSPNSNDLEIALWDEETKQNYIETFLRIFQNEVSEERYKAVRQGVEDMVAVAKERVDWCKYVELTENLEHTKSIDTMYNAHPPKYVTCRKFNHRSLNSGNSFEQLWPFFRGIFCLGCVNRDPLRHSFAPTDERI